MWTDVVQYSEKLSRSDARFQILHAKHSWGHSRAEAECEPESPHLLLKTVPTTRILKHRPVRIACIAFFDCPNLCTDSHS